MNGISIPSVKVEHDSAVDMMRIKSEPGSVASASPLSDDELDDDTGEIDLMHAQNVHLMRLPTWLWENWASMADDEEIRLGTVRVESIGRDSKAVGAQKMSLLLDPTLHAQWHVPQEYNLRVTNSAPTNLYLFSERDVSGQPSAVKPEGGNGAAAADSGLKVPSGSRSSGGIRKPRWDQTRRRQPYYRKAIPKYTALAGVIKCEINCLPVENEEYAHIMAQRTAAAAKPKRETRFLADLRPNPGNLLAPGTLGSNGYFESFIKTGAPARGKTHDQKAARIPQNELLDLIYDCFRRYRYWSLKALKAEVHQPEAYLKSTLEMIADLVKSGRFAMTWTLKPENQMEHYADADVREEQAPDAPFGMDGTADDLDGPGDDDDDDGTIMEDLLSR